MPKYRLLAPHIVDGALLGAGAEIDIDYDPSFEMEPLDAAGERALAAFRESRAELESDYPNMGWPIIDRLWQGWLVRERLRDGQPPKRK
jgi:hypothetical protein